MKIETLAVHSGRSVDPETGAVTPPIHMSTTFERAPDGTYPRGFAYSRSGNPTRNQLEECLRDLEGGASAAAFSSGMAAIMSVFQALSPGDHVIVPQDLYHGTAQLLNVRLARWNLKTTFVDMTNIENVRGEINPATKLILIETPSNPQLKITDIAAVADLAHQHGIACICDNTWASPVLQRCLGLGADLVVHSTTKYLGGHGDVTGGMVVCAQEDDLFREIRGIQQDGGAVPSPFDCWLILRGIRTLPYRMRAHSENAARIAAFLDSHPRVAEVCLSRAGKSPRPRDRPPTDGNVRWHAFVPGSRRQRSGVRRRRQNRPLHASHQFGQLRKPHRAPGIHRGAGKQHSRRPAARVGGAGKPGRPHRRPRAGPGRRLSKLTRINVVNQCPRDPDPRHR